MINASIIIPVLDEAEQLSARLLALQPLRQQGFELLLVDGGSRDNTLSLAQGLVDKMISSPSGRALQMNAGAQFATGEWLFFLHIDTGLTSEAQRAFLTISAARAPCWGRFNVIIDGQHPLLGFVALMMNLRSRITGIATGDQLIFVHRHLFDSVKGFPEQPLMEDVEMSARLKMIQAPWCLSERVITSGRRWDRKGFWSTVCLMWSLRWRYWRGVPAEQLVRDYDS